MKLKCTILEFKEPTFFTRNNKVFSRQILTVVIENKQKLFVEIRGDNLEKIKIMKIEVGDTLNIDIVFAGKEKKGRYYNNIVGKKLYYEWE